MNRSLHWIPLFRFAGLNQGNSEKTRSNVTSTHLHPPRIQWTQTINNKQIISCAAAVRGAESKWILRWDIADTYRFWAYFDTKRIFQILPCAYAFVADVSRISTLGTFRPDMFAVHRCLTTHRWCLIGPVPGQNVPRFAASGPITASQFRSRGFYILLDKGNAYSRFLKVAVPKGPNSTIADKFSDEDWWRRM